MSWFRSPKVLCFGFHQCKEYGEQNFLVNPSEQTDFTLYCPFFQWIFYVVEDTMLHLAARCGNETAGLFLATHGANSNIANSKVCAAYPVFSEDFSHRY